MDLKNIFIILIIICIFFVSLRLNVAHKKTGFMTGGLDVMHNLDGKNIVLITSISESIACDFAKVLKKKNNKCIILRQSSIVKNISKTVKQSIKNNTTILLCGCNFGIFDKILPLCHIHVCPIKCINYDDIKYNKNKILSHLKNKTTDSWDIYWKMLTILKIDEITYPDNYVKTSDNVIHLLKLHN